MQTEKGQPLFEVALFVELGFRFFLLVFGLAGELKL